MKRSPTILLVLFAGLCVYQFWEISALQRELAELQGMVRAQAGQPMQIRLRDQGSPISEQMPSRSLALPAGPDLKQPVEAEDRRARQQFQYLFEALELSVDKREELAGLLQQRQQAGGRKSGTVIEVGNGSALREELAALLGDKYALFRQYEPLLPELALVSELHDQLAADELPFTREEWLSVAGVMHRTNWRERPEVTIQQVARLLTPKQLAVFEPWLLANR